MCWFFLNRKIFAFDLDPKRLATMNSGLLKAGVLCVDSSNQDILTVDPTDSKYSKVEYIIVDPSCSGSGKFIRYYRPPSKLQEGDVISHVCPQGSPCDHYPWCLGTHDTGTPPPNRLPANEIWWPRLDTCSNLFT